MRQYPTRNHVNVNQCTAGHSQEMLIWEPSTDTYHCWSTFLFLMTPVLHTTNVYNDKQHTIARKNQTKTKQLPNEWHSISATTVQHSTLQ